MEELLDQKLIETSIRSLLVGLEQDPDRDGLVDTPARVARAYQELLGGYEQDPEKILATEFDSDYDEMVTLDSIPFYSMCEHHLLPFFGTAAVAYIPNAKGAVVGLSKLARLVECYARRLQLQEKMTMQIAKAIERHLRPRGYGVVIQAQHLCMCARGVSKPGSTMTTTALGGLLKEDEKARHEFIATFSR